MPAYAPSDMTQVCVSPGHGGCGELHRRETGPDGYPVQPWRLDCDPCATALLALDDRWSATVEDITETFDEKKARARFESRGVHERDAIMALAMARLAGISAAEIPPSVAKMITGAQARVPGVTVCGRGHDNTPGSRFCRECGSPMTKPAAAAGALTGAAA
jgi:hypothetical protein